MSINGNTLRAVCHILGIDPNTTTRIDIDPGERTVGISSVHNEEGSNWTFLHTEHPITPSTTTKPSWELTDSGYIEVRGGAIQSWQQERQKFQEETPIFAKAMDTHNLTVDRRNRWNGL